MSALLAGSLGTAAHAASGTWIAPGGGSWSPLGHWSGGDYPRNPGDIATFTNAGGGTVNINAGVILQGLVFDGNASAYTISPSGGFHLILAAGDASITATGTGANAQSITANILRNGPSTFSNDYVSPNHTLTLSGSVLGNVNTANHLYNLLTLGGSNTGLNTVSGVVGGGVGTTGLAKTGTGTWILSGHNTYQGPTSITGGMLFLSGSHQSAGGLYTGSRAYTIDGGALGGAGATIGAPGMTLGSSAGSALNVSGAGFGSVGSQNALSTPGVLNLELGSSAFDISQAGAGALQFVLTSPGSSDRVHLSSGALEIGTGLLDLSHFTFDLSNWAPTGADGTYVLFSTTSPGAINGSLAASGLSANLNGYNLTLSLGSDGSGFDTLELSVVVLPEPSLLGVLLLGGALSVGWRRWRSRSVG